jgi:tetratricopeptide (TPR) repeat protein
MLSMKDCTDSDLFGDVAVQIDKLRPSALSKYALAMRFARSKEWDKATDYMNEANKLETVDSLKARNYYKLAQFSNEMGKKSEARTHALKAVSLKSDFGAPYILIATMYASSGCSQLSSPEGELHNIAYWPAIDKLVKAKSVDPSVADAANRLISSYSGRFPNAENGFMIGVTKGRTVTVGCWINETTTARF